MSDSPTIPRALILEPGSPKPDAEIGRVLAAELGLFPSDAVARVRYGGGILVARAAAAAVDAILARVQALGVRARAIPVEALEECHRGYRSNRLEILEEILCARLAGGGEIVILREDLKAIQIGGLPGQDQPLPAPPRSEQGRKDAPPPEKALEPYFAELAATSRISPRGQKVLSWLREFEGPPPRFFLTLYARDPAGPIRLEREEIDFSPLGEKKLAHSLDNFLLLAETLIGQFPNLLNRERVAGFLERLDPAEILFFKEEESQNFDRWIQAWIRAEEIALQPPAPARNPSSS
ncbi:MAG: hypothetical protein HY717_01105 [Planctomycetes bacterium]|nr:hypothetical protein [Planctomycetota bacterium]